MKLADFMFTVGYNGSEAIINKQTEEKGKNLSVKELIALGMFKPALCCALYNKDDDGINCLIEAYNKISGSKYHTKIQLMRLFGVFSVPDNLAKVKRL